MKRMTLVLILVLLLSPAAFAEKPAPSHMDDFLAGLSQTWDGLVGMAEEAGQAVSDWADASGVTAWMEDAANSISSWTVESGLADWASSTLSGVQSWADETGLTEWATGLSDQAQAFVEENRPAVEAWLAQAGEEVERAWSTIIDAETHTKAEVEEALDTVEVSLAKASGFKYVHDPRDNPKAMKDIVYNPDAVYGFSPSPDSTRLKEYVDAIDWTDVKQVADARAQRRAYLDSMSGLYRLIEKMLTEGNNVEAIARAVSQKRNELRLESYKDDAEGLETVKKSNLETYGDEMGPSAEWLYNQYGSWQTVLEKALGTNMGMDACLGFYDELYDYYELG